MEERNDEKRIVFSAFSHFMMVTIHPLNAHAAETNGWTKRADLPEERIGASVGVVDGKIYVFGGASQQSKFNDSTYMYDPKTDSWTEKSAMPRSRTGAAYATVDKKSMSLEVSMKRLKQFIELWMFMIQNLTNGQKNRLRCLINLYIHPIQQVPYELLQLEKRFISYPLYHPIKKIFIPMIR